MSFQFPEEYTEHIVPVFISGNFYRFIRLAAIGTVNRIIYYSIGVYFIVEICPYAVSVRSARRIIAMITIFIAINLVQLVCSLIKLKSVNSVVFHKFEIFAVCRIKAHFVQISVTINSRVFQLAVFAAILESIAVEID